MAEAIKIAAEMRERAGKGAARAARRAGRLPAVIYGGKLPPVSITVGELEFNRLWRDAAFYTHMYEVEAGGETYKVLARDVQTDPVMDWPIHIDFLRVSERTKISVAVPVHFVNEDACPGIKEGGVLNVVRHDVELTCRADSIPDSIEVDLTGWNVGDTIHISAVKLPPGVEPTITDRDFTVATIAAPTVVRDEALEAEAEAAEAEAEEAVEEAEGEGTAEEGREES